MAIEISLSDFLPLFKKAYISKVSGDWVHFKDGTKKKINYSTVSQAIDLNGLLEERPDVFHYKSFKPNEFKTKVMDFFREYSRDNWVEKVKSPDEVLDGDLTPTHNLGGMVTEDDIRAKLEAFYRYIPVITYNPMADSPVVLLDPEDQYSIVDINLQVYYAQTGIDPGSILGDPTIPEVELKYAPDMPTGVFKDINERGEVKNYLNTHHTPLWRSRAVTPEYPPLVAEFMEHLFPRPSEREKVLDHMHYMIKSRCAVALVLVGFKKVGKTIFVSNLLKALVGARNYNKANESALKDKFNSALKNYRLVFFDEVSIDQDTVVKNVKNYTNDEVSIEEKGRDQYRVQNHTSIIFATNTKSDVKVSTSDRRFSIPEITEKPLKGTWTTEKINDFVTELKNPSSDLVAQFGHWLLNRKPSISYDEPIKGAYYVEISQLSMSMWQYTLFKLLTESDTDIISYSEFRKRYKAEGGSDMKMPHFKTIISFLEDNPIAEGVPIALARSEELDGTNKGKANRFFQLTDGFKKYREERGFKLVSHEEAALRRTELSPVIDEDDDVDLAML